MKKEQAPRLKLASTFLELFEKWYKIHHYLQLFLRFLFFILKKKPFPAVSTESGKVASQLYLKLRSFIPWGDRSLEGGMNKNKRRNLEDFICFPILIVES